MRAAVATCPHPFGRLKTERPGQYTCKRCGGDATPEGRTFEVQLSPRVKLEPGDEVKIMPNDEGIGRDSGVFYYADASPLGIPIVAVLTKDKAWRFVHATRIKLKRPKVRRRKRSTQTKG